jgi:hypothetical protein
MFKKDTKSAAKQAPASQPPASQASGKKTPTPVEATPLMTP